MRRLIQELSKLPSVGEKSATRLAYHLINHNKGLAEDLSQAIKDAAKTIQFCERCFFLTEERLCLDI